MYLFGALTHDDTATLIVQHGPVGFAHHLEDVVYGIVHITGRMRKSRGGNVTNRV